MNPLDGLRMLAGARRAEGSPARRATNVSMVQMEAVSDSSDGTVMVDPGGMVISGDGSQYVEVPVIGNVREGDTVSVALVGDDNSAKTMYALGSSGSGDRQQEAIDAAAAATTLEAPYTEVEWVEFTGRQFIKLDWWPGVSGAFGFDADFITYNSFTATAYATLSMTREEAEDCCGYLFGTRKAGASVAKNYGVAYAYYGLLTYGTQGTTTGHLFSGGKRTVARMLTDKSRQQCSLRNGVYTAPDGTVVDTGQEEYGVPYAPMLVGAIYTGGNGQSSSKTEAFSVVRVYSLRFYDGDNLAVDLVPAARKSDGCNGLYDRVGKVFYPAQGSLCGEAVGDLGDVPSISDVAARSSLVLQDLRERDSRLITVMSDSIETLDDGLQITVQCRRGTAKETFEAAGIENTHYNPASDNTVYLRVVRPDGTRVGLDFPVIYKPGTNVTTHYDNSSMVLTFRRDLIYNGVSALAAGWIADANYYNNTNNYDRRLHNDNVKAAIAIATGHLICGDASGYQHVAAGVSFDLAYPVLYASAAIKANANAKTAYEAMPAINFSTSGTITGGAAAATIWLRGTVNGNIFTVADDGNPYLTCTVPTTRDGYCYIPLGLMTSATAGYFATSSQLYAFLGGYFGPRSIREVCRYVTDFSDGIMVHPEGDETTGWSIRTALELLSSGVSYIKAWLDNGVPKVRVGREDEGHLVLDANGLNIREALYTVARIARRTGGALIELGQEMTANGQNATLYAYSENGIAHVGMSSTHAQSGYGTMAPRVETRAASGTAQVFMGGKSLTVNDTYNGAGISGVYDVPLGHFGRLTRCRIDIAYGTLNVPANGSASIMLDWVSGGFDDGNYIASVTPMAMPNGFNNVGWCVTNRTATQVTITAWNNNSYAVSQLIGCIGVDSRYGTVV